MANKRVEIEILTKDSSSNKLDAINSKLNKLNGISNKVSNIDAFKGMTNGTKKFNSVFNIGKLTTMVYSFNRLTSVIARLTKESANFIENLNLTEVAFYGNTEAVKELYNNMSDLYNLDESQIVRRIGIFKQMANAMGLSNEQGAELSSLMNKMTLDVSSLYNIDITRASNALQSALVGQTRPIRGATGADITEKTLEKTVGKVVPDRYIRDLSFVEKRLIMVISLTEQLKNSQGDFARTIESPANQMRILSEQVTRASRALGNMFMPIIAKILPYLNAFLMIVTEIANALAGLFGFELPRFDYSGLQGMSDGALDLEEQLDGAGESAKKLKSGLRGFDKLNVITTSSSGAGAGGIGGGIDPRIMEEFNKVSKEYSDMMDKVKTKASKIAEDTLKWLGFEKDINGEYKFRQITLGTVIGSLGVLLIAVKSFLKVKSIFSGLFGVFTGGKVATTVAKTGLLTKAFLALKGALGIGSLATGGVIAVALGAIALAGYGIYEAMQPAIKQIDLFKGISKETENAVKPFVDKMNDLSLAIEKTNISKIVTTKDVENIKANTSAISQLLKGNYLSDIEFVENKINDMTLYPRMTAIERAKILDGVKKANEERISAIEKAEQRINEIVERASLEKRKLSSEEQIEINAIQQKITEQGIKTLTKNEEEQRIILTRIKDNNIALTTEQYSEILKEAIKNRNELKAENEKKYNDEIALANRLYYDLGTITEDEYKKMLYDAKVHYDDQNLLADKGYQEIADTVKTKMGKAGENLDFETGNILTKFQKFIKDLKKWWDELIFGKKEVKLETKMIGDSLTVGGGGGSSGSRYATGGFPNQGSLFVANEAGPEVVSTLGGKTVVANMEQMMTYLDRRIDTKLGNVGTQKQPAVFNINVGSREYARYMLEDLNEIAKNNGQALTIGG